MDKLKKNSTIKEISILNESKFFTDKKMVSTNIPAINIALSGDITGGFTSGLTTFAGVSKNFKTGFSLLLAKAYMDEHPDSVLMFYDSEFGTPQAYFDTFKIDTSRVLHIPISDVEQLKFDVMKQLETIENTDKVIFVIDSIGNLASKKEVEDTLNEKSVADMSRAKQIKSLFRMVTPHLTIKDIPMVVVNHTYKEMCLEGSTKIKTADGIKSIKDIKKGEFVYSLNGTQEVINVFGPTDLEPENKRFLKLTFDDGSFVKCTHDHKFLMKNNEWVQAEKIKIGEKFK